MTDSAVALKKEKLGHNVSQLRLSRIDVKVKQVFFQGRGLASVDLSLYCSSRFRKTEGFDSSSSKRLKSVSQASIPG
jgi:hypothetical protein